MVTTDTLEGTINGSVSFHYDIFADVLYLRLTTHMQTPTVGEENDDGDIVLLDEATGQPIGLSVISWWKRFGHGTLPDSISEIQKRIEPLAGKVAA